MCSAWRFSLSVYLSLSPLGMCHLHRFSMAKRMPFEASSGSEEQVPWQAVADTTDWSALSHAYGSAWDLPQFFSALRSDDDGDQREALDELYARIVHQGTRYDASAFAVAPLIELVADPAVGNRDRIIYLLVAIAFGFEGH